MRYEKVRRKRSGPKKTKEPAWGTDDSALRSRALSKAELGVALNVKKGILRYARVEGLARRVGNAEAEKILKLALYIWHEQPGVQTIE